MRLVWDPKTGEWHKRERRVIGPGPGPMIMAGLNGVYSHADGQTYYSRREWNRHLNRHNMVELGEERLPNKEFEPPDPTQHIVRAFDELDS